MFIYAHAYVNIHMIMPEETLLLIYLEPGGLNLISGVSSWFMVRIAMTWLWLSYFIASPVFVCTPLTFFFFFFLEGKKVVFCEVMPAYILKGALLSKNALVPYYHNTHTLVLKIADVMWKGKVDE